MQRALGPLAASLIWGLMAVTGSSWAGPVQHGQTLDRADQLATTGLAASAVALGAGPAASASALAAEIIKEAEATSHAGEQARSKRTQTGGPGTALNRSGAGADESSLRQMGKAAIRWARESLPWLRRDPAAEDSHAPVVSPLTGWSTSLGGERLGQNGTPNEPLALPGASGATPVDPESAIGYGKTTTRTMLAPGPNLVRTAIDFILEVLEHPMTWLVVSLVIIGSIVVKRIDRRPTK